MTAIRRLWLFLVCLKGHRWTIFLEENRKCFALSVECEDCDRVLFFSRWSRKTW